jgi:catechol-2,3-dioxygenase
MNTITQTRPAQENDLRIDSLAFVTAPVVDIAAARRFYSQILGLQDMGIDQLPGFGPHAVLRLPSGQFLVLTAPEGPDTRDTGVHNAFRVSPAARAAIAERLAAASVEVLTYKEDRPKEDEENFFFLDADGNRIQLVRSSSAKAAAGVQAIDHTVVLTYDMLFAEAFYGEGLKLPVESRVGVRTADHARARKWEAGEEQMAPGTRRLDKLYMTMGGKNEVARANMQVYFTAGSAVFGIYLATKHQQEPPEEQLVGTPRTAFLVGPGDLERIAAVLRKHHRPFEGPVDHPKSAPFAASLYCKDQSGNFLEFCVPRR